tara:strand:+ start:875 stop:1033 length:159 start_codon:yes stop_codon:yes gene_type:complete
MYYISKGLQFIGLAIIGMGFISKFPHLMDYKLLGIGLAFFIMGYTIQKYGLQ